MVRSILNQSIDYKEKNILLEEDINYETELYEIILFGINIDIAVGKPKYDFVEKNIIYYPVYLVKDLIVIAQIGIYEIAISELSNVTNDEGMLDLTLINKIIPYSFVSDTFLKQNYTKFQEKEGTTPIIKNDDDETDDIIETSKELEPLKEQTSLEALEERNQYDKKIKPLLWINKFMKNNNYGIIDNEGAGDCLFAVIRDALQEINKIITVDELRKILSDNATEDLFNNYRTLFNNASENFIENKTELKTLTARHKALKAELKKTKDSSLQTQLLNQIEDIQKKHKETKISTNYTEELLNDFKFMKNIKTLPQLREKIQTCEFWGDTWAISTLERVLNIKFIILSEEYYENNDIDHVLLCGQLNDEILETKKEFNPSHYIILNHEGNHYKLITYKNHRIFTFIEIPYHIKMLVINKCLEKLAGPYAIIPDFLNLKLKLISFQSEKETEPKDITIIQDEDEPEDDEVIIVSKKSLDLDKMQGNDTEQPAQSDLYNVNGAIFQFYYKSADKPSPGMGAGEQLGSEGSAEYNELKSINGWRRMLSNFWMEPFVLHGHTWGSVEHYYQASKFKKNNSEFYLKFTIESNSDISKDPSFAKSAGGKTGKYKGIQVRAKNIVIDPNFFDGQDVKEMEDAMYAKFSQNENLKRVLLATKRAKLTHFKRGSPPVVFNHLMRVRQRLINELK